MRAATIASTSAARDTSAVKAIALPPSPVMILTVSSAAAPLRSTQNTCAPSRANVTAVALPLPQPGPIEPAPTTIATLPLRRSMVCSLVLFFCLAVFLLICRGHACPRRFAAARNGGMARLSLERHIKTFGDVGAEAGGDG